MSLQNGKLKKETNLRNHCYCIIILFEMFVFFSKRMMLERGFRIILKFGKLTLNLEIILIEKEISPSRHSFWDSKCEFLKLSDPQIWFPAVPFSFQGVDRSSFSMSPLLDSCIATTSTEGHSWFLSWVEQPLRPGHVCFGEKVGFFYKNMSQKRCF